MRRFVSNLAEGRSRFVSNLAGGRLVMNHSTHIEGLIPALRLLASNYTAARTVVPGRLKTCRGRVDRLKFKITGEVNGGHRVIARKGTHLQEVFIRHFGTEVELDKALAACVEE